MATIKDVADLADVSIATVSRVLNRPEVVSHDLQVRVESAMHRLNYYPNAIAQSLKTKVTSNIGVVINDMRHFDLTGLTEALSNQNLNLVLRDSEDNWGLEAEHISDLMDRHVDGFIIAPVGVRHVGLIDLEQSGIPAVFLGDEVDEIHFPKVAFKVLEGAYQAVAYLIANGHRKIGFIAGMMDSRTRRDLFTGFKQALGDHNVPFCPSLIRTNMPNAIGGAKLMTTLLRLDERPTALFVAHPMMAQGVMQTLYGAGLRCPDDVSVIVFGDTEWASAIVPPMTVLKLSYTELATCAVDSLVKLFNGNRVDLLPTLQIPAQLIERDSVSAI